MGQLNILVVTDAQNDFRDGALGTAAAVEATPYIVKKVCDCGEAGYIIVDTMDTHDDDYLETNEGKHLPVPHTIRNTKGWEIVDGIRIILDKYDPVDVLKDRFGSMDLAGVIRVLASKALSRVVTTGKGLRIVIIGWCTDICVITNALLLKTALPEADIVVDSKCCAGTTPEAHQAALTVLRSCQITVE